MNKAILWDLDGTLLYTLSDIANATNQTLIQFGLPTRELEEFYAFVGNGARNQLLCAIGYEPENFEEIHRWYRDYYAAHSGTTCYPYPGIKETVATLKQAGFRLAIVTNKPNPVTQPLCQAQFPEFDFFLGEEAGTPRKPAPDMIFKTLAALQVSPENAIYVGDSEVDIATAKAAGLTCISVTWGYRSEQTLIEAGATHLCRRTEDIPRIVEEITHGQ